MTMLNVDKYREAIMSENVDTNELDCHIAALRGIKDCGNCECAACMRESFRWLFSEYEPPLLKNGDGLKPGDWIMVKIFEDGEWVKRQFAFFHDGWFYYLRGGRNFAQLHLYGLLRSEQSRLPKDGE